MKYKIQTALSVLVLMVMVAVPTATARMDLDSIDLTGVGISIQKRIVQYFNRGDITRFEASRLSKRLSEINSLATVFKNSDGGLSRSEKQTLLVQLKQVARSLDSAIARSGGGAS